VERGLVGERRHVGSDTRRLRAGGRERCGNGTVDPGEQCDDGNTRAATRVPRAASSRAAADAGRRRTPVRRTPGGAATPARTGRDAGERAARGTPTASRPERHATPSDGREPRRLDGDADADGSDADRDGDRGTDATHAGDRSTDRDGPGRRARRRTASGGSATTPTTPQATPRQRHRTLARRRSRAASRAPRGRRRPSTVSAPS
jgi:hypothetical protein